MEIVAFDTDDKADGSGKAKITWISKDILPTKQKMNSTHTSAGGWERSAMRTYLKDTIKPLIPETVRNAIIPVTKVSSTYAKNVVVNGQSTTDDVWIPSNHEIFSGVTTYESTGVTYSSKFDSTTNRIKKRNGSASFWWLRSAKSSSNFCSVNNYGITYDGNAGYDNGVALGFCT